MLSEIRDGYRFRAGTCRPVLHSIRQCVPSSSTPCDDERRGGACHSLFVHASAWLGSASSAALYLSTAFGKSPSCKCTFPWMKRVFASTAAAAAASSLPPGMLLSCPSLEPFGMRQGACPMEGGRRCDKTGEMPLRSFRGLHQNVRETRNNSRRAPTSSGTPFSLEPAFNVTFSHRP